MLRRRVVAALLLVPVLSAPTPRRKDVLTLHVTTNPASKSAVVLETRGLVSVMGHPADATGQPAQRARIDIRAPEALMLVGLGEADLVIADTSARIVAEVRRSFLGISRTRRYTGRALRITHMRFGDAFDVRVIDPPPGQAQERMPSLRRAARAPTPN